MTYTPHAAYLKNAHLHTVLATRRHIAPTAAMRSEQIPTPDGDFLELDWHPAQRPSDTLVILSHGLEGHSRRPYILGMARALHSIGVDALAWSCRGCSGTPNALPRLYHCGSSDDLETVVQHAARDYKRIFLVGFSMGANMSMLYLGRHADRLPAAIAGFVAVSPPCDLNHSIRAFERPQGLPYTHYFLRTLKQKIRRKAAQFPDLFDTRELANITSLRAFDDRYTAPLHGFKDAVDYWTQSSSRPYIAALPVPGAILTALDDPFLSGGCYPTHEVAQNPRVTMITPQHGGHVGFLQPGPMTWSERYVVKMLLSA
jgi:uncharacterized protein